MDKTKNISLLAVSFRQGFESPNIPIALFKQGDKNIVFLLDSGSDKNVIDTEAVKNFEHNVIQQEERTTTHLTGVGGTKEVEMCNMSFKNGDETYNCEFLITDLKPAFDAIEEAHCIRIHGILGSSFLKEHNAVLDFKTLSAYSKT